MKKKVILLLTCVFMLTVIACRNSKEDIRQKDLQSQKEEMFINKEEGSVSLLSNPISDNMVLIQQGKTLGPLARVGEDGPYYCNLEGNLTRVFSREPEEYPVLVCKDPVYDITYYVNYGRDFFIYAKRGEKTECVVEIPARDLYCRDGVLYFRAEEHGIYEFSSFKNGAVLAYHPVDGSVEVVIDMPVYDMAVYPDGIMYAVRKYRIEEDGTMSETRFQLIKYFYSFEMRECTELGATLHTMARWKDYWLVMKFVNEEDKTKTVYYLETPEGTSVGELPNLTEILESRRTRNSDLGFLEGYRVMGNDIYYIVNEVESLMRYDMETGKEETVVELAMPSLYARTFMIHDDAIYFSNGIRYSFDEDKQYKTVLSEKTNGQIQSFYTDGEELYILVDGVLWLYEERRVSDYGMEISQITGRYVTVGCYEAVLHPLGE